MYKCTCACSTFYFLPLPLPLPRLATGMSEEDYTILKATLLPAVSAGDEQVCSANIHTHIHTHTHTHTHTHVHTRVHKHTHTYITSGFLCKIHIIRTYVQECLIFLHHFIILKMNDCTVHVSGHGRCLEDVERVMPFGFYVMCFKSLT